MMNRSDLTTGSINHHIAHLAIPAAIGFFFNVLYNIVDTVFAGSISTDAQSALGFAFPLFFLIISGSVGIGQGTTTLVSNALGLQSSNSQINGRSANAIIYVHQSFILAIFTSIVIMVGLWLCSGRILDTMGSTGQAKQLTLVYIHIIAFASLGFIGLGTYNGMLSAQGDTQTFGIALVAGTILNIVFNALFVFGFGWGMAGIALATCLVQYIILTFMAYRFMKSDLSCVFHLRDIRYNPEAMRVLLRQSIPAAVNMLTIAVGYFLMTRFFAAFGPAPVAASTIANRLSQLFLLPTIGVNMAVMAIAGQNFGAGKFERVWTLYRNAMYTALALAFAGSIIMFALRDPMMRLMSDDPVVLETGRTYLVFMALGLPAVILVLTPVSLLQAIKRPMIGPFINILRLILIPLVLISVLLAFYSNSINTIFWGELINFWLIGIATPLIAARYLKRDLGPESIAKSVAK